MFDTLIVQPLFNLLVLIYALFPYHNLGVAIILFTVLIRLLLWPLVKKQLHQTKLIRRIQPDLKRIAKETKGDRQRQALLQMELYKEKGINPLRNIGLVLIQLPIFLGLFFGIRRVIDDPGEFISFAYEPLRQLPWLQQLAENPALFDNTLFGIVDLSRSAVSSSGFYFPAFVIVLVSVVTQYFQAKQLMPVDKDAKSLRLLFKEASQGKQADQQEAGAAIGRVTLYLLPGMIFLFTIGIASALSLYWFVSGLVALIQQTIVLREDQEEMQEASEPGKKNVAAIPEAEVIETESTPQTQKPPKKKTSKKGKKKRRK